MKILIITQRWYPDTFGGSEHVAAEQAKRLAARGHSVTVLTERVREVLPPVEIVHNSPQPSLILREGGRSVPPLRVRGGEGELRIYRYGSERQLRRRGGLSRTDLEEVEKLLRTPPESPPRQGGERWGGWDVAILHHPFAARGFFKARLKIPALYLFHTSTAREAEVEGLRRKLPPLLRFLEPFFVSAFIAKVAKVERMVLSRARQIAVLSDFSSLILKAAYPFTEKKIIKLPIGIDQKLFKPAADRVAVRRRLGLTTDRPILLTVRRFTARMGLATLIEAMKKVCATLGQPQLFIIGEGPLKETLARMIKEQHLEGCVTLVGAVPVEDLPLYYQAADLFVLPTAAFEGLGMSTLEALSCGLPVVGTPAGATLEVLGALDPTLVTRGIGAPEIAEGILGFFARSPQEREALRKKAREVVEQLYGWERAVDELEKVLGSLKHDNTITR